jgi:hypothetical protein
MHFCVLGRSTGHRFSPLSIGEGLGVRCRGVIYYAPAYSLYPFVNLHYCALT